VSRKTRKKADINVSVARFSIAGEGLAILCYEEPPPAQLQCLTEAERSVVAGLLCGHSRSRIALERARSPVTVDHQVSAIYRKLGVHSRGELVTLLGGRRPPAKSK
jgi:DNA-binding NarL/FixJ family response regulator